MGVKKTIKKIVDSFIPKDKPTPMSGGNSYETNIALEVQKQLDLQSIQYGNNVRNLATDINNLKQTLDEISNKFVFSKTINPYILLNYQANYFCGTCKFETSDMNLKRMVLNVIRGAFLFGVAGILKEDNNLIQYYITNMEWGIDGKLKKCKVYELELMINNVNKLQREPDTNKLAFRELNEDQCKNLAVFQWGVMGFSAWITIWPFINFQNDLLTMILIQSFIYNKKFIYTTNNFTSIADEMELFFNPTNPFVVNVGATLNKELPNRFTTNDLSNNFDNNDLLDYYNKTIAVYYHIFGRRINNDVKKERNVSNEVEASQENYDIIQSDWLNFFEIFINNLKKISGIDIKIVKESFNQEKEIKDVDNIKPDNRPEQN